MLSSLARPTECAPSRPRREGNIAEVEREVPNACGINPSSGRLRSMHSGLDASRGQGCAR